MPEPSRAKADLPPIPAKRYFTIGEVSDLCAVKPHVLRYWEQEFTQLKPVKRRGNRRYYQHHEVLLIRRIRELLYEQGFTINGARHRLESETPSRAPPRARRRRRRPACPLRRPRALDAAALRQELERDPPAARRVRLNSLGSTMRPRYNRRFGRGVAQPGSAPAWGAGGRKFESSRPDQIQRLTAAPAAVCLTNRGVSNSDAGRGAIVFFDRSRRSRPTGPAESA